MNIEYRYTIYTDGACSPNPGRGGWAAIIIDNLTKKVTEISGAVTLTTNNRMEIGAVLKALYAIKESGRILFHTDSMYVIGSTTKWIKKWEKQNWKKVKNVDLWLKYVKISEGKDITFRHVKSHSNSHYNNRADELAVMARTIRIPVPDKNYKP